MHKFSKNGQHFETVKYLQNQNRHMYELSNSDISSPFHLYIYVFIMLELLKIYLIIAGISSVVSINIVTVYKQMKADVEMETKYNYNYIL